jgi:hypothetical protein
MKLQYISEIFYFFALRDLKKRTKGIATAVDEWYRDDTDQKGSSNQRVVSLQARLRRLA